MTNPIINPQPNYSGVTIQIANPAVNVGDSARYGINPQQARDMQLYGIPNPQYGNGMAQPYGIPNPQYGNDMVQPYGGVVQRTDVPQNNYVSYPQQGVNTPNSQVPQNLPSENIPTQPEARTAYPNAYPAQYYLNNYNYGNGMNTPVPANNENYSNVPEQAFDIKKAINSGEVNNTPYKTDVNTYKEYGSEADVKDTDLSRSKDIIDGLNQRAGEAEKEKKNTKETKIVALTDDYIKSLENYLNNQNDDIRLMASKEVLKRLDEDKDRYNDAALNALLNKMMQDPSKLIRLAALSAFSSGLASGNDYTVQLLQNIQSNPNADKEDALQAADILLKMSAGVETKNIPITNKTPENNQNNVQN